MQSYIEFEINGVFYSVAEIAEGDHTGKFCWSNSLNEEGYPCVTLLEAYQNALYWEGFRTAAEAERVYTEASERYELE